jgi:hypothetical protein
VLALGRRLRSDRVAVEPGGDVVVVELLGPHHPAEGLAHHHGLVVGGIGRGEVGVELVGFLLAGREHAGEALRQIRCLLR